MTLAGVACLDGNKKLEPEPDKTLRMTKRKKKQQQVFYYTTNVPIAIHCSYSCGLTNVLIKIESKLVEINTEAQLATTLTTYKDFTQILFK